MLSEIARSLTTATALVASLALTAGLGLVTGEYGLCIAGWALCWLPVLRTRRAARHRHVLLLAAALVAMIAAGGGIAWAAANFASAAAWINVHWGAVLASAGFTLPPTVAGAITLLNALALAAWTVAKFVLLQAVGPGRSDPSGFEAWFELAYRRRESVWRLKPWWLSCRSTGWMLTLAGVGLLAWQWWNVSDPAFSGWVRLFPAALIPLGIEWVLWLSGEVDEQTEPEFVGGTAGPVQLAAVFEDLWSRYRRVWRRHWRAAGNRPPEFPHDG